MPCEAAHEVDSIGFCDLIQTKVCRLLLTSCCKYRGCGWQMVNRKHALAQFYTPACRPSPGGRPAQRCHTPGQPWPAKQPHNNNMFSEKMPASTAWWTSRKQTGAAACLRVVLRLSRPLRGTVIRLAGLGLRRQPHIRRRYSKACLLQQDGGAWSNNNHNRAGAHLRVVRRLGSTLGSAVVRLARLQLGLPRSGKQLCNDAWYRRRDSPC